MSIGLDHDLEDEFRDAMAGVCTTVSVVTTTWQSLPFGTTVSSFVSVSMDPPMVLVLLDRRSELLARIGDSGVFGLNVLASHQPELAATFARKGGSGKFDNVAWQLDSGVPRLPGAGGFVGCAVADRIEAGDHVMVLGHVRRAERHQRPPLTYYYRTFGTHTPI